MKPLTEYLYDQIETSHGPNVTIRRKELAEVLKTHSDASIVEIGCTPDHEVVFEAAIKQLGHTILDTTWVEETNTLYYKVEK